MSFENTRQNQNRIIVDDKRIIYCDYCHLEIIKGSSRIYTHKGENYHEACSEEPQHDQ